MESPIHALKFAEDLLFQVLQHQNAIGPDDDWGTVRTCQDVFSSERCPLPIYDAVLGLMSTERRRIDRSFDELIRMKVFSVADFRFEASVSMIAFFRRGYEHMKFLYFCALLGGVSVRYARAGHPDIPSAAAQVLAYLLNFWMYSMRFDPERDYFALACFAQRVRRKLMGEVPEGVPVFEEAELGRTSTEAAGPSREGGSRARTGRATEKSEGSVAELGGTAEATGGEPSRESGSRARAGRKATSEKSEGSVAELGGTAEATGGEPSRESGSSRARAGRKAATAKLPDKSESSVAEGPSKEPEKVPQQSKDGKKQSKKSRKRR